MKKIALAIIILIVTSTAHADTITATAEWDYPSEFNGAVDGFRLYDHDHRVVSVTEDATARTIDFKVPIQPGECSSYYLVAFKGSEESPPSNIYPFCRPVAPLRGVGTFTIEFK